MGGKKKPAGNLNEPEAPPKYRVHLNRTINSSATAAFRACTEADILSQWFTTAAQIDLQKNGNYSNADGDRGVFLEIDPPHRLTFTWDNPGHCPGSIVTYTFRDLVGERVLVRLLHRELKSDAEIAHMREGWQWALTNLKLFLEEGRTITFEEWKVRPRTRGGSRKRDAKENLKLET